MTWINTIGYEDSDGALRDLYDRVKGPGDNVDNIMLAHSLRPHTMEGHMAVYKKVLHHRDNTIDKWFLEAIGVFTSTRNGCAYCVDHHYRGLVRLLKRVESSTGADRAQRMLLAMQSGHLEAVFDVAQVAALLYAKQLTEHPAAMSEADVDSLRASGWNDGQILEINQVTAYFNYANRTVLGLGVGTEGDVLGLSPGDTSDDDNWQHD